jgi:hypothetical protein
MPLVQLPLLPLQDCDEVIESYTRTRSAYNLAPPSTYRTASQRLMDVVSATFKVTVGVLGWVVSVPGKLWSLRKWSRDDWSGWWSGIKKTVKEEAHHYWVSQHSSTAICRHNTALGPWHLAVQSSRGLGIVCDYVSFIYGRISRVHPVAVATPGRAPCAPLCAVLLLP